MRKKKQNYEQSEMVADEENWTKNQAACERVKYYDNKPFID